MSEDVFDSTEAVEEFRELMTDPSARQAFVQLKAEHARSGVQGRYRHILQVVGATPWAIRPEMLGLIVDLLAFRAQGGRLSAEEIEQRVSAARRAPAPGSSGGVAVLPLHGVIVPRASAMTDMSGGTSIDGFRSMFREAMASDKVSALVIDVDSPGGMVDGVPEMAAEIRAARAQKPIVAVANTEAASAAYWLAAQASSLVVSKSARVGSIGVFTAHEDQSQKDAKEGMKTTLISAGKYKTEGNPFEPLTEEARANTQKLVDSFYGMFVSDIAKGRGVTVDSVRGGFGEGRMVGASDAVAQGMADRIGTTEDVVRSLLADPAAALPTAATSTTVTHTDAGTDSSTSVGSVYVDVIPRIAALGGDPDDLSDREDVRHLDAPPPDENQSPAAPEERVEVDETVIALSEAELFLAQRRNR